MHAVQSLANHGTKAADETDCKVVTHRDALSSHRSWEQFCGEEVNNRARKPLGKAEEKANTNIGGQMIIWVKRKPHVHWHACRRKERRTNEESPSDAHSICKPTSE